MPAVDPDRDTVAGEFRAYGPDAPTNGIALVEYVWHLRACGAAWADTSGDGFAAVAFSATLRQAFWLARQRGWPGPDALFSNLVLQAPDGPIPAADLDPFDAAVVRAQVERLWAAEPFSATREWAPGDGDPVHPCW